MIRDSINYTDTLNGNKTLLFLHYFGGSSRTWIPVIEKLKDRYRCIAVDLPGFGGSPIVSNNLSVTENAALIFTLIEKLHLKNFIIIGHSMGGKIALALSSLMPIGFEKLILVAPSPPTAEPMSQKDRTDLLAAYKNTAAIKKIIKSITHTHITHEVIDKLTEDYFRIEEKSWKYWVEKGSRENISSEMASIHAAVFIISGKYDKNLSTDFLHKEFIQYFPGVLFKEIKQAAHLVPVDAPEELASAIAEFSMITSVG